MTDLIDNSNFIIAQIKERAVNTPRIVSPRSRRFTKEFREIIKDAINADIPLPPNCRDLIGQRNAPEKGPR